MEKTEANYLEALDIGYSYDLAKKLERFRSNPVLGYRTAGSVAERQAGQFLAREMERIRTDTLHSLFYDHPLNCRPFFPLDKEPFPLYNTFNNLVNC